MNKIILIAAAMFFATMAFAQDAEREERRDKRHERMEAQRIAYITNELELTTEEAQRFWPIYNQLQEEKKAMRPDREKERALDMDNISDAEASRLVQEHLQRQEKELQLRKTYFAKLNGVLSPQKQLKLVRLEGKFRKDILKKYKKRMKRKEKNKRKDKGGL